MAEFTNGKTTLLYVDVTTPLDTPFDEVTVEDAVLVACLDNNGFTLTSSDISTSSKCSAGNFAESIGGEQGWSMSADGKKINAGVGDTRYDNNKLFKLARTNTNAWWFMFDTAKLSMRYGIGRINNFDESMPNNDAETFSIAITGVGYPGDQDDIAPIVP